MKLTEDVTLLTGDAREAMSGMPPGSAACVVTSPPYYSLRDYGVAGQYGLEATPDAYVSNMRDVFSEARRVLSDDGTLWINLGDSYYSAKGAPHGRDAKQSGRRGFVRPLDGPGLGMPRKSLVGIPYRVALALQDDGWTWRADIVWRRKSAMPEPTARDRPWRTTERLLMFSKRARYWFDRSAVVGHEDVWTIEPDRTRDSGNHAASYPVELPARCISAGCKPDGVVLDPFSGSGTTGVAALLLGRSYIGVDLNPSYHDIARTRLTEPAKGDAE